MENTNANKEVNFLDKLAEVMTPESDVENIVKILNDNLQTK